MSRTLHKGPRGGVYYVTAKGNRCYVERSSLPPRYWWTWFGVAALCLMNLIG